jgi:hypothetical protein
MDGDLTRLFEFVRTITLGFIARVDRRRAGMVDKEIWSGVAFQGLLEACRESIVAETDVRNYKVMS